MLKPRLGRRGLARALCAVLIAVVGTGALTESAGAAGPSPGPSGSASCPAYQVFCIVEAQSPGTAPSLAGRASTRRAAAACTMPAGRPDAGRVVPCRDPVLGGFQPSTGCYLTPVSPPPPPSDPAWAGNYPNGAIYQMACLGVRGTGGGWVWRATPPAGLGGPSITAAQLAQRAVELLGLRGPRIGIAPPPGTTGLVGVPVWLWTEVTPTTWGPTTATASVPGLSVTATAQAQQIRWDLGDGATVTCANPGTPYRASLGGTESPTCGHRYAQSSADQPQARYPVTATTTWRVTWTGGGQNGVITLTRASTTTVSIGELQVLVT